MSVPVGAGDVHEMFHRGTYRRARSLLAASIEHALYGMLVFSVGLGRFFFHGTS